MTDIAATTRVALVTGGSRGIGLACSVTLAEAGWFVGINYRSRATDAESALARVRAAGGDGMLLPGDVGDPDEARQVVESLLAKMGRLDVLVNNAGLVRDGLILRMADETWDEVLRTDLAGPFYLMRAALRPMLRQRWGRIISIGSVIGIRGNAGQANYAAAKAGLIGLSKAVAREVASRSITVNVVAPGYIDTEMTSVLGQAAKEALLAEIPAGRTGKPAEVAALVRFLAGEEAAYITGQVFVIDGGLAM